MATAELKGNVVGFKVSLQQQSCPLSFQSILCFLLFWDSNDVCRSWTRMHQIFRGLDNQADLVTSKLTCKAVTSLRLLEAVTPTLIKRDCASSPDLLISFAKARFSRALPTFSPPHTAVFTLVPLMCCSAYQLGLAAPD